MSTNNICFYKEDQKTRKMTNGIMEGFFKKVNEKVNL